MKLTHYQNQPDLEDRKLLKEDAITFSVLLSIMNSPCQDIYTDHENIIICFSKRPYPIWVWCKNTEPLTLIAAIAHCLKSNFPLEQSYTYNLSYELLEALKRWDTYFENSEIKVNLLSYRLDTLCPLIKLGDGKIRLAQADEIEVLAQLYHDGALEMEGFDFSLSECQKIIRDKMADHGVYVLENHEEIAAIACKVLQGNYGKVSMVYTVPKARRRGYALRLVHHVTTEIMKEGRTPILYTDADYAASNACYQKIGYQQVGSLCTVQKKS